MSLAPCCRTLWRAWPLAPMSEPIRRKWLCSSSPLYTSRYSICLPCLAKACRGRRSFSCPFGRSFLLSFGAPSHNIAACLKWPFNDDLLGNHLYLSCLPSSICVCMVCVCVCRHGQTESIAHDSPAVCAASPLVPGLLRSASHEGTHTHTRTHQRSLPHCECAMPRQCEHMVGSMFVRKAVCAHHGLGRSGSHAQL